MAASFWTWKVVALRGSEETDMQHHLRQQAIASAVDAVINAAKSWREIEFGDEEPMMKEIGDVGKTLKAALDSLDAVTKKN